MHSPTHPRTHEKIRVLFLCTGNSCRSQMAEGWTRYLHAEAVEVFSAGTAPHGLDPMAVQVMAEAGVDISNQKSDHVDEYLDVPFDLVVTVCDSARESCPYFPGHGKKLHRSFDDPPYMARDAADKDEALGHYRRVRDEIRDMVTDLKSQIPDLK